ncbi:unnamed protein product [Rhizophagus irregularis]|uniref:Uncharacterized protein n=1 Tax=Rhizophagus irregularis TaxID=588596 RepID=A0A915ZYP7_9GLOM|nr:unnamed protein product [Rhizophagus irregularis]
MNNDTPQHTPSVKDVDKNIINDPGPSTSTSTTSSSTSSISTSPTTPQILFPQCSPPPTNDSDNESTNNRKRSKARINDETDTPTSGSKRQYLQTVFFKMKDQYGRDSNIVKLFIQLCLNSSRFVFRWDGLT